MNRFAILVALCTALPASAVDLSISMNSLSTQISEDFLLQHKQSLEQIYTANNNQPIWQNDQSSQAFEALLEIIAIADLSDHFYQNLIRMKEARMTNNLAKYDVIATDTLLSYITYTELSADKGRAWYFGSRIPVLLPDPDLQTETSLVTAIKEDNLLAFIQQNLETSQGQQAFLTILSKLLNSQYIYGRYFQKETKHPGDFLEDKAALIERLALVGIDTTHIDLQNNLYDSDTEHAVIQFQHIHGLEPDGVIGRNTMHWLNISIEERARILALNSERLRLWELKPESAMVVNVPDFRLLYRNNGENYFETKVIVGRKSRKTPLLKTQMDAVILNPTWNVPQKIMVKDILPAVKQDAGYIEQHNYKILQSWNSEQTIAPEEIDWESVVPRYFPYRLRQDSGPTNALGLYKFNTPNPDSIYLHDTPSKYLFNKTSRAFSSGCIRVQNADKLASLLLNSHISEQAKAKMQQQNITTSNYTISLTKKIPVNIIYQTAWVEDGQVQYRSDVYQYDQLSKSNSFEQKFAKLSQLDKLLLKQ